MTRKWPQIRGGTQRRAMSFTVCRTVIRGTLLRVDSRSRDATSAGEAKQAYGDGIDPVPKFRHRSGEGLLGAGKVARSFFGRGFGLPKKRRSPYSVIRPLSPLPPCIVESPWLAVATP